MRRAHWLRAMRTLLEACSRPVQKPSPIEPRRVPDLAFVTGYGRALLTNLEGRSPLVRPEDAVAFAFRDHGDQAEFGSQPLPPELRAPPLAA
jgi:hypothetical protein